MVHIYTAPSQPATAFVDRCTETEIHFGYRPGKLLWCGCCHKRHRARNVVVQCFYDGMIFWCAPGKGCKDPRVIESKKRREFRNRSKGQKRRYRASASADSQA